MLLLFTASYSIFNACKRNHFCLHFVSQRTASLYYCMWVRQYNSSSSCEEFAVCVDNMYEDFGILHHENSIVLLNSFNQLQSVPLIYSDGMVFDHTICLTLAF